MVTSFDSFSGELIEETKRFYEKAVKEKSLEGEKAYLHASLVLGFSSLEAQINGISDDLLVRKDLPLHEKAILSEKEVRFKGGEFFLSDELKMYRLEDRIEFIYWKFKKKNIKETFVKWSDFKNGLIMRNWLSHPKEEIEITEQLVEKALRAIVLLIDELYLAVFRKNYPSAKRGIESSLKF